MKRMFAVGVAAIAGLGVALSGTSASAQEFGSPELIAAAKAEGKLVLYTANFAEVEQDTIKAFNKRFPEIKIEMVRAPGGQLITRVKTEAAAGKLIADIVDHSDRALMLPDHRHVLWESDVETGRELPPSLGRTELALRLVLLR